MMRAPRLLVPIAVGALGLACRTPPPSSATVHTSVERASPPAPLVAPPALALGDTFRLAACNVTLKDVHASRDWMPEVYRPGPDGGTPLRMAVYFSVSATGAPCQLVAERAELTTHAPMGHVDLVDASTAEMSSKPVSPGEVRQLGARAIDGPYLEPGASVSFVLVLRDLGSGQRVTITTPVTTIDTSS